MSAAMSQAPAPTITTEMVERMSRVRSHVSSARAHAEIDQGDRQSVGQAWTGWGAAELRLPTARDSAELVSRPIRSARISRAPDG